MVPVGQRWEPDQVGVLAEGERGGDALVRRAVEGRDEEGVAPIDLATAFGKDDCVRHPEAAVFMFGTALSRQRTRLQLLHFFNDVLE